jgi:hypothetical protein
VWPDDEVRVRSAALGAGTSANVRNALLGLIALASVVDDDEAAAQPFRPAVDQVVEVLYLTIGVFIYILWQRSIPRIDDDN